MLKRKSIKKRISFKEFERDIKSAKSPGDKIINSLSNIKLVDRDKLFKYIIDNWTSDKLSKNRKYSILLDFMNQSYYPNSFTPDILIILEDFVKLIGDEQLNALSFALNSNNEIKVDIKNKFRSIINAFINVNNDSQYIDNSDKKSNSELFDDFFDSDDYDGAIKLFDEIKISDKKQSNAAYKISVYLYKSDDLKRAKEYIKYALEAKPKNQKFLSHMRLIEPAKSDVKESDDNQDVKEKNELDSNYKNPTVEVIKSDNTTIELSKMSKDDILDEYNLSKISGESLEFIISVAENKRDDEGYLSYYEANIENHEFIIKVLELMLLNDDTSYGYVKAANKLTFELLEKNDKTKASNINNLALNAKPNNVDAKNLEYKIKNFSKISEDDANMLAKNTESTEVESHTFNIDENYDFKKKKIELNNLVRDEQENLYKDIIDVFIKDSQIPHVYSISLENKNGINALKTKVSCDLWFLDQKFRTLLIPYFLKIENYLIKIAKRDGLGNIFKTRDVYWQLNSSHKDVNNLIFNVESSNNIFGFTPTFSKGDSWALYRILTYVFRQSRNFLVHSQNGLFNHELEIYRKESFEGEDVPSKIEERLERLSTLDIISQIATGDAKASNKIFYWIIFMIIITNDSKVSYKLLSDIDYKLYTFISSSGLGKRSEFYKAIGLKEKWFDNIVSYLRVDDENK